MSAKSSLFLEKYWVRNSGKTKEVFSSVGLLLTRGVANWQHGGLGICPRIFVSRRAYFESLKVFTYLTSDARGPYHVKAW